MILVLTQCLPPDPGGIETTMGGLLDMLGRAGVPALVLADRIRGGGAEPAWAPGTTVRRFGGPRPLRRWRKRRAARAALRRLPIAGVLADSWKSLETLPVVPGAPVAVALVHGMEFPAEPAAAKRRRIAAALARAGAIVANSRFTAARVAPFLADRVGRLTIVQPVIPPQPAPTPAARAALAPLLAGGGPILLTLCRLEPRKGIDRVLGALPALLPRHPRLRYLIAGGGEDRVRLEALAAALGVAGAVRFLGRVDGDAKAALYAAAQVFAMPARRIGDSVEGFGTTYLEAAWYGVPALAGSDGGAAEAVLHGQTGLVCDGEDQTAVTAALGALLDDPQRRAGMGRAAAARVRADFLWPSVTPRWLALLGAPPASP